MALWFTFNQLPPLQVIKDGDGYHFPNIQFKISTFQDSEPKALGNRKTSLDHAQSSLIDLPHSGTSTHIQICKYHNPSKDSIT